MINRQSASSDETYVNVYQVHHCRHYWLFESNIYYICIEIAL